MSIEEFFNHKCNIYHMLKAEQSVGYGINTESFTYADKPDLVDVECHINVSPTGELTQTEVANEYIFTGKLSAPIGTDLRVNDKIIDSDTGLEYTVQFPKNIRNHHITAVIFRKGSIKGAI